MKLTAICLKCGAAYGVSRVADLLTAKCIAPQTQWDGYTLSTPSRCAGTQFSFLLPGLFSATLPNGLTTTTVPR